MNEFQPSRRQTDLAEVIEMLLDKGIVINADIAVSIGDTQLLGIQIRAAIASFETAAKYGLEFPEGTDMRRLAEAAGEPELADQDRPNLAIDPTRGVNMTPEPDSESETEANAAANGESDASGQRQPHEDERGQEIEPTHPGGRPEPEDPSNDSVDIFDGGPLDNGDDGTDGGGDGDD